MSEAWWVRRVEPGEPGGKVRGFAKTWRSGNARIRYPKFCPETSLHLSVVTRSVANNLFSARLLTSNLLLIFL